MKIPWAKPYIGRSELEEVKACFDRSWLSMGQKVEELEEFASGIVGSSYGVAVNSGTAALDIALKLIGVGPGDEVIVPALAYIATANAVLYQQARPVFADIDEKSYCICPKSVEHNITDKTKAVIAIDYAGQAPDYNALRDVLGKRGIFLIEDGAPGLGGSYRGKPLCSRGDVSITSFHMAKIFTSVEGGMLFTDKQQWDAVARMIRSQGEDPSLKYHHPVLGHNYRMSDIYAAIGLEQLKRFDAVLNKRAVLAQHYSQGLSSLNSMVLPRVLDGNKHAWFLYPVLVSDRDKIAALLKAEGIETNISWPMPVYEQKIYKQYFKEECSVAKRITQTVLCLPIYYEMTEDEQDYVIDTLVSLLR